MKQASASATATASSSMERCHKRARRDDEGGDGPPSTKNNPTDSITHPGLNNPQPPPQEQQQQEQTDLPPKYGDQEYWEQRYKRLRKQDNGGNNTKTTTRTGSTTHYDKNDDTDGQEGVRTSRYTSAPRFSAGTKNMESNTMGEDQDGNKDDDDVPLDDEGNGEEESMTQVLEPLPYHAWYFSYQELRPLLIPLIFGDDENHEEDGNHQENQGDDGEDVKEDEKVRGGAKENEDGDDGDEDDGDIEELSDDNECIEFEQVDNDKDNDDDDDDDEGPVDRGMGLMAEQGPIDVLEIGCGDVPLGVGLAQELWALEQARTNTNTGAEAGAPSPDAQPVARHILCTDYSPAVIAQMQHDHRHLKMLSSSSNSTKKDNSGDAMELSAEPKEEGGGGGTTNNNPSMDHGTQNSDNDNDDIRTINNNGNTPRDTTTTGLQLEFAVADACNLHFVPNQSRALILEKGTLDAMLSDPVHGLETCRQAVRECARILTVGGYIVLISYQNAHTPQGLEWLRQVIYEGLKTNKPTLSSSNNNHDDDDEKQNSKTSQSITSPKDSISTVTTSAETINIPTVAIADPNTTPSNKVNQSYRWKIEVHGKDEASTLPERMDHDMERNDDHVDNDDDDKGIGGSVDKKKIREGPGPAVYVIHKEPLPRTNNSDADNKKSAVFTRVENEEGNESARPSDYDDDDDGETIPIRFYSY